MIRCEISNTTLPCAPTSVSPSTAAVLSKKWGHLAHQLHCVCCQPYHHVADGLKMLLGILFISL